MSFVLLTFGLSWLPAALLAGSFNVTPTPGPFGFLLCAATYAACMGWQPILALALARRVVNPALEIDEGMRRPQSWSTPFAAAAACLLYLAAWGLSRWMSGGATDAASARALDSSQLPSGLWALAMFAAGTIGMLLVWLQSLAEEVGWRGYFLPRLMHELGAWRGLSLHGAVWGIWYAPIVLVFSPGGAISAVSAAIFVVTCMLLGILLGWLRLASTSVVPPCIANSVLTLASGLPLLLFTETTEFTSVLGPAGWVPMVLCVLLIVMTRYRTLVRVPLAPTPLLRPVRSSLLH